MRFLLLAYFFQINFLSTSNTKRGKGKVQRDSDCTRLYIHQSLNHARLTIKELTDINNRHTPLFAFTGRLYFYKIVGKNFRNRIGKQTVTCKRQIQPPNDITHPRMRYAQSYNQEKCIMGFASAYGINKFVNYSITKYIKFQPINNQQKLSFKLANNFLDKTISDTASIKPCLI